MWCLGYVSPESFLPLVSVLAGIAGAALLLGKNAICGAWRAGHRIVRWLLRR